METTNISQRVAAISGAASGIGLALATLYARRGIRVIAGYYPDDPHDPTVAAAQVEEAGGDALWLPLNVADTASVDTFIAQGVAHYGRLDYVIANAGILRCASIEEMNDDRWNEMLNAPHRRDAVFPGGYATTDQRWEFGRNLIDCRGRLWLAGARPLRGGESRSPRDLSLTGR